MFDTGKTRMIGLPYGEKNYDDMLNRFHLIPERYGRTDRRTDLLSISRVSVLTRDKNCEHAVLGIYLELAAGAEQKIDSYDVCVVEFLNSNVSTRFVSLTVLRYTLSYCHCNSVCRLSVCDVGAPFSQR